MSDVGSSAAAARRPPGARRLSLSDDRGRVSGWVWVGVPLVMMVLCWRALALEPKSGLGSSWEAALHMALHEHVAFGNHLIFTYGPLGFLSVPTLWYGDTGTIAVLYTVLLRFALALALFYGAWRSYGMAVGAVVALGAVAVSAVALETVPFLVFCVWMVDRTSIPRGRLALMAAAGGAAGMQLLNKESIGIEMTAMAVIVALAAPGRRRDHVMVTLSALMLVVLAGWIVTGQDLSSLPAYARNGAQIVSGYASAMGFAGPGLWWEYFAGLLAFAFGLLGAIAGTSDGPRRRRWGVVTLWLTFCFFEYKEGFVRHDEGHGAIFFVALAGGFLALRWRWGARNVGLCAVAVLLVFAVAAQGHAFTSVLDPGKNSVSAIRQLVQVLSPSQNASIRAKGRRAIERDYPLDQATLALLRGHTVHVEPFQTAVVWAYRLAWRPLPVFQSYSAYTSALDRQDADTVSSARAPQRILRNRDRDIDDRVQSFDEGSTMRAILCRYQELHVSETWQVLGLASNRCLTAPVPLGTVHVAWNQKVAVPAPPNDHSFVFVRIGGVQVAGLERVLALLYKPATRRVLLNGRSHRLVEGTAADGLVLRAPAGVDFARPFKVAPDAATIAVSKGAGGRGAGQPITFAFFAQPVSAGPRGALGSVGARAQRRL